MLRAKYTRANPPEQGLKPFPPLSAPGLEQVYDGPDARLYRIEGAMPRAFVVGAQQVVRDGETARQALAAPGFDARRVAITEERLPGLAEGARPPGSASAGRAQIVSYEDERVVVRASSKGSGVLVLSDNNFPGWKAEVDGRPADVEQVDYLFRGVRIGPGSHTVEFRYEPLSWTIGWIISTISLAVLAVAVIVGIRRRRRAAGDPSAADAGDPPAMGAQPMAAGVSRPADTP